MRRPVTPVPLLRSGAALLALLAAHAAAADSRPAPRSPEQLYREVCARCHEVRVGPPLLGRAWHPLAVEAIVRGGRAAMPAFRESEISPAELAGLAAFLQTAPAPADVAASR